MIALQIVDVKDFMNKLLVSETFDHFLLSEATISTNVTYTIDGHLNKDFFSNDELEEQGLLDCPVMPFSSLRSVCFQLIRGKKTPLSFQFTFQLSPKNAENTIKSISDSYSCDDVSAIFFHVRFSNQKLSCVTGIAYRTFTLDHTLDHEWDRLLQLFLKQHEIAFEVLT
ncbi:MAG: DUF5721 family protein [Lachnospiraceae bacterium]